MHLFILNYPLQYAKRPVTYLQGERQCRCVVWIINWALQIHCNPRVPLGANQLVSKGGMETDDTVLQKMYLIWYSFRIVGKSFARPFEVKQLPFSRSCSWKGKNHLIFISNNEKWLSLKKSFWKVYHHSKCFGQYYMSFIFSISITIWKAWLEVWKFIRWLIKST